MSLSYSALGERAGGWVATSAGTAGGGGPVVSVACLLHPDRQATRTRMEREGRRMAPSPAGSHPVELGPSASTDEDRACPGPRQRWGCARKIADELGRRGAAPACHDGFRRRSGRCASAPVGYSG